jgi:hypothetical protein
MRRSYILSFVLLCSFSLATKDLCAQNAAENARKTISYQGMVTSVETGEAITGMMPITATLYVDENGTEQVWQGFYNTQVTKGIFQLQLGSGSYPLPDAKLLDHPLWVGIRFGETETMKPLTPLSAAPYALTVADKSITANKMATDYVSGVTVDGKKITSRGTYLNLKSGPGVMMDYDEQTNMLTLGTPGGIGGQDPQWIGNNGACLGLTNNDGGGGPPNTNSIGGGCFNTANPPTGIFAGWASIIGGNTINANGQFSTYAGGHENNANGQATAGVGGEFNDAGGNYSFLGGGQTNNNTIATAPVTLTNYATLGGGKNNRVTDDYGTLGGGRHNTVGNDVTATVNSVTTDAQFASNLGGNTNTAAGSASVQVGGEENEVGATGTFNPLITRNAANTGNYTANTSEYSYGGGGYQNRIENSDFAVISGGQINTIGGPGVNGTFSVIDGGFNNTINGSGSIILGGANSTVGINTCMFNADPNNQVTDLTVNNINNSFVVNEADFLLTNVNGTPKKLLLMTSNTSTNFTGAVSTGFVAPPTLAASIIYVLPSAAATTSTSILSGDQNGNLSWITGVDLTTQVTNVLPVSNGGTGNSTIAPGDLLVGGAGNTLSPLTISTTAGDVLTATGTGSMVWAANTVSAINFGTVTMTGVVPPSNGGTGLSSIGAGDLLVGSSSNALTTLPAGTSNANKVLAVNSSTGSPEWRSFTVTDINFGNTNLTGALSGNHGGTGLTSVGSGDLLVGGSNNTFNAFAAGTSNANKVLAVNSSTGLPEWRSFTVTDINFANTNLTGALPGNHGGTGLTSVSSGDLLVGGSNNTFTALAAGTSNANKVLVVNASTGLPEWRIFSVTSIDFSNANLTGAVPGSNGGTGLTSINSGDLLVGASSNTYSALPKGTSGQVLGIDGSGNPAWINTDAAGGGIGLGPITPLTLNTGSPNNIIFTFTDASNNRFIKNVSLVMVTSTPNQLEPVLAPGVVMGQILVIMYTGNNHSVLFKKQHQATQNVDIKASRVLHTGDTILFFWDATGSGVWRQISFSDN